jgi:hypothetical protein
MTEPRDYNDVYAEQVAGWQEAVAAAVATVNAQQAAAASWLDGGLPEGTVGTPGQLEAPPSVVVEQANEPPEAPAL